MIYAIFCICIIVLLAYLTVIPERKPDKIKNCRTLNLIIASFGLGIFLLSLILGLASIKRSSNGDEWIEWAENMFLIYFDLSMPIFLILFGIILLATLMVFADKKSLFGYPKNIRIIMSQVASAVLLVITPFYAFTTANDKLPIDMYIIIAGVGEALVFRFLYVIEYTARIKNSNKQIK